MHNHVDTQMYARGGLVTSFWVGWLSEIVRYSNIADYSSVVDKRLNTGMAPTCDWMIKIVKFISYILTPCTWVLLTACTEAEQWNIDAKTPTCQTRNGYLHNEDKAESIFFS